jgi:hypothetical protein
MPYKSKTLFLAYSAVEPLETLALPLSVLLFLSIT